MLLQVTVLSSFLEIFPGEAVGKVLVYPPKLLWCLEGSPGYPPNPALECSPAADGGNAAGVVHESHFSAIFRACGCDPQL